jgi:non-heme chloroperoxidase
MPYLTTNDQVKLHYLEAGSSTEQPLVMIPGWSQTAQEFKYQIDVLCERYRIIALDMRGHGESCKPQFGYKISRFAKDLHDVLRSLSLNNVVLLGHSMGCSVIWCYWDLFGKDRISKLILVDQSPCLTKNPLWTDVELEASGAVFTPEELLNFSNDLVSGSSFAKTRSIIDKLTIDMDKGQKDWVVEENMKFPRPYAALLHYNHGTQDWRDVIPRIDIPTLVVGGRVSAVPWKSQCWIHKQINGSRLEIFEKKDGGGHFMFIEGAKKFNQVVMNFV